MFHVKSKKNNEIYILTDIEIKNPIEDSRLYLTDSFDYAKFGDLKDYEFVEQEAKKQLENINNKEIHFFNFKEYNDFNIENWLENQLGDFYIRNGYSDTKEKIDKNWIKIITTQMALLSTSLFEKGYQIFIHGDSGIYEIKIGSDNERTKRKIGMCHDLFKLWESGEFR